MSTTNNNAKERWLFALWKSFREPRRDGDLSLDIKNWFSTRDFPLWFRQLVLAQSVEKPSDSLKKRIPHIRQTFDWDCGIVCLQMTLPFYVPKSHYWSSLQTRNWLESRIGTRSTWTIDLVALLDCLLTNDADQPKCDPFDYLFCSRHLSVNSALATMGFYSQSFAEDSSRVIKKYNSLKSHSEHRMRQHDDLSLEVILKCLRHDNCLVILLLDYSIFQSMIQNNNERQQEATAQQQRCPFIGHYVLLVRCIGNDQVLVHDPGRSTPITVQKKALESAWSVPGTDSDAIVIVRFKDYASVNIPPR
jgi:Guanylylate cyclase